MDKRGAFTDLFLFMIIAFILVLASGILIYATTTINGEVGEQFKTLELPSGQNASALQEEVLTPVVNSFSSLYWISIFLIFGMIISIWIGSYLVTTKPIFFIPYIFVLIIAVIVSVAISNSYEMILTNDLLGSTYSNFIGASLILAKLPIVISVVGVIGAIIMFVRMGSGEQGGGQFVG